MKKCDYLEVNGDVGPTLALDKSLLEAEKKDEIALPKFVKEIPTKKRIREKDGLVTIDYSWDEVSSEEIRVKTIEYRKQEKLEDLYRISKKDGLDEFLLRYNNRTYVLRKTTKNIAIALLNAYSRLKGLVENVVGWLKTFVGNVYVIAKVERLSWTFNKNFANRNNDYEVNLLEVSQLDNKNREKLLELLTSKLVELHKKGLVLRNFSMNNIWLMNNDLLFADLRNLKLAKKKSVLVEEFRKTLNYLFSIGIMDRAEAYAAIAYYLAAMEESCNEWYYERIGKSPPDEFEVSLEIEKRLYN